MLMMQLVLDSPKVQRRSSLVQDSSCLGSDFDAFDLLDSRCSTGWSLLRLLGLLEPRKDILARRYLHQCSEIELLHVLLCSAYCSGEGLLASITDRLLVSECTGVSVP